MLRQFSERRAKIVCTLGPASSSEAMIRALAEAGMNVARFNFSHGSYEQHQANFEAVRKVSRDLGRAIAVLQDLQGPKIRVQLFENGQVELNPGDPFTLTTRKITGTQREVSVSYDTFTQDVKPGDMILLDDGLMRMTVERVEGMDLH